MNQNGFAYMKLVSKILLLLLLVISVSCNLDEVFNPESNTSDLKYGSDLSIIKLMEDYGGVYKLDGIEKEGLQIFKENGYTWARLRLFHSPYVKGQLCNDLEYTLELTRRAKNLGFKILLDIVYSDDWADKGHQTIPEAWQNLRLDILTDSVYFYTKNTIEVMSRAGLQPDMVQIGNDIGNGFLWPQGYLWEEGGNANWDNVSDLLKAGIKGVRDASNSKKIKIMIHAATAGEPGGSKKFYENIISRGVEFDVIGISYYPWWHGEISQLENSIYWLSKNFKQELSVVETAYYSNGWYPESSDWVLISKPYPPTEQGQFDYLTDLAQTLKLHPRVKTVFYWKPDELNIPESKVPYQGRSLFDDSGNALKGLWAWKNSK